jgi:FAD binding domain
VANRVVVLGAGPAGLAAAHAATLAGRDVTVMAPGDRSPLYGSQYLHAPIPGMTSQPPVRVTYRLEGGSYADYQVKAYGRADASRMVTGSEPEEEIEFAARRTVQRLAWDIRQTYDALWSRYQPVIQRWEYKEYKDLSYVLHGAGELERVYSTIPLPLLCQYRYTHVFRYGTAWAAGEAPDLGIVFLRADPGAPLWYPNTIAFHAGPDVPYYRTHNVYAHRSIEWPGWQDKPDGYPTASYVKRPLWTNCDCWPSVVKLGRYGAWNKSQLVNHVFSAVYEDLWKEDQK